MRISMQFKCVIILTFLVIGSMSVVECSAQDPIRNGYYLSKEYSRILEETKSPLKAAKASRPQSAEAKREAGGILLRTFYDFNEGGPVFKFGGKEEISVVEGAAKDPNIRIQDASNFSLAFSGHPMADYRFVQDAGKYAEQICLIGRYRAKDGSNAEFTEGGEFILGKTRKHYSIGLYYPPSFAKDYFTADSVEYGFSRSGDTLKVFEVAGGSLFEDGKIKAGPSLVLVQASR